MKTPVGLLGACALALCACQGSVMPDASHDASPDASSDAPTDPCANVPTPAIAQLLPARVVLAPGAQTSVQLRLARDACVRATYSVSVSAPSVATAPATVTVDPGAGAAEIPLTAGATPGHATVTVAAAGVLGAMPATLDVTVSAPALPPCPDGTTHTALLAPGGTLAGDPGTPLATASLALPMRTVVAPAMTTLACAASQAPAGYTAAGPAVSFAPGATRYGRDVAFTLPVDPAAIPARETLRVQVSYTGPSVPAPAIVPVANGRLLHTDAGYAYAFEAPRAGTYQAVVRADLGARTVTRHLTYRAIMGVSMGSAGAALVGLHNPDRFDSVVALGGPVEWNYTITDVQLHALGGFCTAAQRAADPTGCDHSSSARTPPVTDPFEHGNDFEHLYEEAPPNGTTFSRAEYVQIFRDLGRMFGDPLLQAGPTGFLPLGVPDTEAMRSDADRCASPVVLQHYYDAAFNPDGSLPVIAFCDGSDTTAAPGVWDPTQPATEPVEVSFAVDLNRNGVRDGGEPLLTQLTEPFRDVGTDGLADAQEPGYDAANNPDPAGDDYDWQYNPSGTEGNRRYDGPAGASAGEPYDDVGLDGVPGTPQASAGGYDTGEGNGRFDTTAGLANFHRQNPLDHVDAMDDAAVDRLAVYLDGGVRDLVNFAVSEDHLAGGFARRPGAMALYNGFAGLTGFSVAEDAYDFPAVDWAHVPRHVMDRYGSLDAAPDAITQGDGTHTGTTTQAVHRIEDGLSFIAAQWPGADRGAAGVHLGGIAGDDCTQGYVCTLQVTSERAHRTSPTVVLLPPGYHDAAHADERYPVIVLLHGYGGDPTQFQPLGLVLGPAMGSATIASWARLPKAILVLADGKCREGDNCLGGTFFADGIAGSAQIETAILDLLDTIDARFRTLPAADVTFTE